MASQSATTKRKKTAALKTAPKKDQSKGLSDKQIDSIAETTGKALKMEPSINVIIPKVDGDSDTVECCINGYNYVIKKGEMVRVPKSVVDVLRNADVL